MKLLVTGGLGFIGSNFIRLILKKYPDYKVVNLDIQNYAGNPNNLKDVEDNPQYGFIKGDICDEKLVEDIFSTEVYNSKNPDEQRISFDDPKIGFDWETKNR